MSNKAIKYRIYPTEKQQIYFAKCFGCCRKIYNLMLADKKASYEATKKFGKQTPAMYKEKYPYLKEVDSLALCNVQLHLEKAITNCTNKKRKKRNNFPKFKSKKKTKKSFTTNNQKPKGKNETIYFEGNYINLPKIGLIKLKQHRLPKEGWKLKSVTISQNSCGEYYTSVLFEFDQEEKTSSPINNVIGLDYASNGLYIDDKGNIGSKHKFFRESQTKLAREQRKLSRKQGSKKGEKKSNNYKKQQKKVNRIYRHIANQRLDNLHKLSTEIANQYDVVCVETLNMKAMSNKGFGNGKATLDNGYGMFLRQLEYKLEDRNKHFIEVDKWYPSSQICHNCGKVHPEMKNLENRTMLCDCGLTMGRDQNAAINIKKEGLRLLHEGEIA